MSTSPQGGPPPQGEEEHPKKRKKHRADFNQSEPEFLISCLDRHRDLAVVVCLVGGGQEINTGEAGISECGPDAR